MFGGTKHWFARWRRRGEVGVGAAEDAADDQSRVLGLHPTRIPSGRQWRVLPSFFSLVERRWIRFLTFTTILSAVTLLIVLAFNKLSVVPKAGGSASIGFVGAPQFINPVLARENTVDGDLTKLLFRGVVKIDKNFQAVPDLAESMTVSDDKKTYTVVFRRNIVWSDGEPITADDLKFTLDTVKDADFGSPLRSLFQTATVEVTDDRTAIITLDRALAAFPSYLAVGLLPRHAWSDATPQTMALAELNVKPISNGPFRFMSVTKDRNGNIKSLTFIRNKTYTGTAPYLNRVTAKFYPERTSAIEALRTDAVDALDNMTVDEVRELPKKFVRSSFPVGQLIAAFFNQRENSVLKVQEIRRALAMTTDRQGIVNAVFPNAADPIVGPVLPGYIGYNQAVSAPAYDPAAANALLESQGWKRNKEGVRQKGAQQFVFTLTVPDDSSYVAMANRLITDWQAIGAGVELKTIDASRIQREVIRPRDYEVLLFGQILGADGDLYSFWHSSQQRDPGFNLALFFNQKIDQVLASAHGAAGLDQRIKDYQEFQTIMAEELPAVFILQQRFTVAHDEGLRGLDHERLVTASDRFRQIEAWYVRTKLAWR